MRMKALASGSSGNSIYVGTDNTHLLVDTGVSKKRIEAGLNEIEISGKDIDGILITHEHSDHIGGLGVFLRKYPVKVYATQGTINGILEYKSLGKVDESLFNVINYDEKFMINDIEVSTIKTSHDANQPCAYRFGSGSKSGAVMTDLGCYDDYIVQSLKGLDALYIEANHDIRMLELGPYPYQLKKRILGKKGHLSNEACGRLLDQLLNDDLKAIVLSHLSKENNLPELAYEAVRMEVNMSESKYRADDFPIMVAKRDEASSTIIF